MRYGPWPRSGRVRLPGAGRPHGPRRHGWRSGEGARPHHRCPAAHSPASKRPFDLQRSAATREGWGARCHRRALRHLNDDNSDQHRNFWRMVSLPHDPLWRRCLCGSYAIRPPRALWHNRPSWGMPGRPQWGRVCPPPSPRRPGRSKRANGGEGSPRRTTCCEASWRTLWGPWRRAVWAPGRCWLRPRGEAQRAWLVSLGGPAVCRAARRRPAAPSAAQPRRPGA